MKSPVFCGLDRTRTCDLADVNGAFYPTELQDLTLLYLQCVHRVQYLHCVIVGFGNKFSEFAKQPFVIDNTNVTRSERARYVDVAKVARLPIVGYSFQSTMTRTTAHSRKRNREHLQRITTVSA